MTEGDVTINGTLVWYYYVCPREVWLMGRHILPEENDTNVDIGQFIHQHAYARDKKEITIGGIKLDIIRRPDGELVVGEMKKSSRSRESARMQLLFYLRELHRRGVEANGELLFPEEKRREKVVLTPEVEKELEETERHILAIIYQPQPPPPRKLTVCRSCAYREFCWA